MRSEDLYLGVEYLSRGVRETSQGIVLYRQGMILEGLDDRPEIWIAKSRYLFIPLVHQFHRRCPFCLPIEEPTQFHRKFVGLTEHGIVPEKNVDALTLDIIPFVTGAIIGACLLMVRIWHDLSVGVCLRCL